MNLDHVENATFFYSRTYTSSVYYENTSFQGGSIYGIDMNYLDTCGYMVRSGRGFIQKDYDEMRKVVLVDSNAADNLFAGKDPVGKTIEIGSEPFTVIGVVEQNDDYQPNIKTIDEYNQYYQMIMGTVMIPNKCWPMAFKFDEPENAVIRADSTDNMSSAGNAAADIMNQGIYVSGGGAAFPKTAEWIKEEFKIPVHIADRPEDHVILGMQSYLKR